MKVYLDGDGQPQAPENKNFLFSGTDTGDNVGIIRRVIRESTLDGVTREAAENVLRFVPEKDWPSEISALFEYVKNNMRYTLDMGGVEMVKTPARHISDIHTRGLAFGDCDDHVCLLGALLYNAGYENIRLVIMRSIWNTSGGYNHIYLQVLPPGSANWISLDATEKSTPAGTEPQSIEKRYFNV